MRQNVPLELGLIDEGRFLKCVETDLQDAQRALIEHCERYGDRAKKATAEVTIKIKFSATEDEGFFGITATSDLKKPGRPAVATLGVSDYNDGEPSLFVKASGSDREPRQAKFLTEDGRKIDVNTGEVADPIQNL